jgi:hypothetical protein
MTSPAVAVAMNNFMLESRTKNHRTPLDSSRATFG